MRLSTEGGGLSIATIRTTVDGPDEPLLLPCRSHCVTMSMASGNENNCSQVRIRGWGLHNELMMLCNYGFCNSGRRASVLLFSSHSHSLRTSVSLYTGGVVHATSF